MIGVVVYRGFGAFIPIATAARGLLAGGVAFGAARSVPSETPVGAVLALAAGFAAFGVVLVVTRELGARELEALRKIIRRKRDQPERE